MGASSSGFLASHSTNGVVVCSIDDPFFREIVTGFKRHGATVLLVEVRPRVLQKLVRGGVIAHVGAANVIDTLEHAQTRAKTIDLVRQHQFDTARV